MTRLTAEVAGRPAAGTAGSSAISADARPGISLAVERPAATRVPRPTILGEVAVVLLLLRAYDMIREHSEVRAQAALRNGWDLLNAERLLHIDFEPAVNRWTSVHHAISLAASYWYQFFHITVTLLVLLWCYWRRPGSYRRARNALVLTNVFGLGFFLAYPAAPPRFLPGAGFIDAVADAGFGASHGGPVTADQYGAFPSLHLAWAVWTAVVAARLVRPAWLRRLWLSYPLITASVVVATGNHYILDVLAGIVIALISLALAYRYPRSRSYGRTGNARSLLRRLRAGLTLLAARLRPAGQPPAPTGRPSTGRSPATPPRPSGRRASTGRASSPVVRPPVERQPATVGDQDLR
jgi:membrane-associated phospholipid phosphatase